MPNNDIIGIGLWHSKILWLYRNLDGIWHYIAIRAGKQGFKNLGFLGFLKT